jgi:hypothetical protein
MRFDLTQPINDLNGVQIVDKIDTDGYTLRSTLIRTALAMLPGKQPSAEEKLIAYSLAKRIATANQFIDLSAKEVVFLHDQGGAMWSPLVMGQLWDILDNPLSTLPMPTTEPEKSTADIVD